MKISLEYADCSDLEVIVKGNIHSEEAVNIISALNNISAFGKLMLRGEDESILYDAEDIIYFEAAQGKTYAVTETGRYEINEKLYELSNTLNCKGFIQINKSTVVNINYVLSVSAEFSGNYTARLKKNKGTLIISRKYFNSFKNFVRR